MRSGAPFMIAVSALALDALAPIVKRGRKLRFVVAGTGTAEQELKRQAKRLGMSSHGTFLGWVGDDMLHDLYRAALLWQRQP